MVVGGFEAEGGLPAVDAHEETHQVYAHALHRGDRDGKADVENQNQAGGGSSGLGKRSDGEAAKASAAKAAVQAADGRLFAARKLLARGGIAGLVCQNRFERFRLIFLKRDFQLQRRQFLVQLFAGFGSLNRALHRSSSSFSRWHSRFRARMR